MPKVLAELNIATALAPLDSPKLAEFVDNLERVNELAEQCDGFVWRLKDESGNATDIQAFDNPNIIVNLSVWRSVDALKHCMFKTDHIKFFKKKTLWFEKPKQATYVLWWIDESHIPSIDEGIAKLQLLREHGDHQDAFSFKRIFDSSSK